LRISKKDVRAVFLRRKLPTKVTKGGKQVSKETQPTFAGRFVKKNPSLRLNLVDRAMEAPSPEFHSAGGSSPEAARKEDAKSCR